MGVVAINAAAGVLKAALLLRSGVHTALDLEHGFLVVDPASLYKSSRS